MSRKKPQDSVQKTGRPRIPIENGYQMNMAEQFKDRHEPSVNKDVEFAGEISDEATEVRDKNNKKRKAVNLNENKPNFKTKNPSKKS
ncbi:hypothetical protein RJG79_07105 [Mycoplasmatota bacterium WC44]